MFRLCKPSSGWIHNCDTNCILQCCKWFRPDLVFHHNWILQVIYIKCRSQLPRCLRRTSAAARLPRLWVRIPPGAWMSVYCKCCVMSGRGLLGRADHSSRGVLPTVVRRCVWFRNPVNEAMAHWGPLCQKQTKIYTKYVLKNLWNLCIKTLKFR